MWCNINIPALESEKRCNSDRSNQSMNPTEIIQHNRELIQQVIGRRFLYKPIHSISRKDFEAQVELREEAEYLERVYGIKNKFKSC